ncbi:prepilin-type N-terminal cleavage/methylation domain-containing protein [Clostridium sp. B9]|uniref:prepilin-type N-terminal cleavage/methylation domain-containing protein n=1 Tax=Clostridium sp. B9 TaxID=3423224 RepID=UPI003D2EB9D9
MNERIKKKKKGFTLIELIIVIAIIAILAAIAIPNFLSIQRKARVNADIATAKTLYDASNALIAEGNLNYVDEEGRGIYMNRPFDPEAEVIYKYLGNYKLNKNGGIDESSIIKPQSLEDGQFFINIVFENGDKSKPDITVSLLNKDNKVVAELYPNYNKRD